MQVRQTATLRLLVASALAVTGLVLISAAAPSLAAAGNDGHGQGTEYVSTHGSQSKPGKNCGTASFSRIGDAVAAAPDGGIIVVCPGTYAEDVLVQKPLTLIGQNATIDATGLENAIQVVASGVTVRGFRLVNANGEGLLFGIDSFGDSGLLPSGSPVLSGETVQDVKALNDDRGFNGTENGNCKYPGDCGGGIHLNVVENSVIEGSQATGNADGILLTDDYGPNAHNLLQGNFVSDNRTECGIVLPSHSSNAVSYAANPDGSLTVTGRNPDKGGVYDNVVRGNVAIDNGTATAPPEFGGVGGSGSGIGVFGSGPGSGAYDNLLEGNYLAGNGLAGITFHAHHPGGEDINGNDIVGNVFATNNVAGDTFDGGVSNFATTGVAIYSVPPVEQRIANNVIRDNAIGIWLTNTVTADGLGTNAYRHVGTPVVVEPAN